MGRLSRSTLLLAVATALSCADDRSAIEETTAALSVCDEVVPANRFVDGIPAYAQCAGFENAAIYSNNGVDTSTTSLGADWIRTQGSGGYQCTELAHRYLHFRWNVTSWLPRGNAGTWCDTQPTAASGVVQTTAPVHGDLIVFAPGSCGADATTGHVAVVDTVDAARAQVTVVEENRAGRRNTAQTCAACYLHVVANDGSSTTGAGGATGFGRCDRRRRRDRFGRRDWRRRCDRFRRRGRFRRCGRLGRKRGRRRGLDRGGRRRRWTRADEPAAGGGRRDARCLQHRRRRHAPGRWRLARDDGGGAAVRDAPTESALGALAPLAQRARRISGASFRSDEC